MEDTTMLEGSQGLFEELNFTIYPNGLSEERMRQVCDASDQFRNIANRQHRSKVQSQALAEQSYLSM